MIGIVSFTAMVKENLPDKAFAQVAMAFPFLVCFMFVFLLCS